MDFAVALLKVVAEGGCYGTSGTERCLWACIDHEVVGRGNLNQFSNLLI